MDESRFKKHGCFISTSLILLVILGFFIFQFIMNSIVYFIFTWPIWLSKLLDLCLAYAEKSIFNKLLITGIFSLIGLLFYLLKKRALIIFGVIEFVGGVFILWGIVISPSDDNLVNAIAIGAGLFTIVQGAENYYKAIENDNV